MAFHSSGFHTVDLASQHAGEQASRQGLASQHARRPTCCSAASAPLRSAITFFTARTVRTNSLRGA